MLDEAKQEPTQRKSRLPTAATNRRTTWSRPSRRRRRVAAQQPTRRPNIGRLDGPFHRSRERIFQFGRRQVTGHAQASHRQAENVASQVYFEALQANSPRHSARTDRAKAPVRFYPVFSPQAGRQSACHWREPVDLCPTALQSPARGDTLRAILSPPIGAQKTREGGSLSRRLAPMASRLSPPAGLGSESTSVSSAASTEQFPAPTGANSKPRQERQRRPGVGCRNGSQAPKRRNSAEPGVRSPRDRLARRAEQSKRRNCIARCPQTEREQREVIEPAQFRGDQPPGSFSQSRTVTSPASGATGFRLFRQSRRHRRETGLERDSARLAETSARRREHREAGGPEFIDGNQVLVPQNLLQGS